MLKISLLAYNFHTKSGKWKSPFLIFRFYDALPGDTWLVNATEFGHADCLDESYASGVEVHAHCSWVYSPKWKMGKNQKSVIKTRAGNSLISLKSNERLWAILSDRSRQMSDGEQIAQVAQRKWATVSESLRSLKTNEQLWAICCGCSEEMCEWALRPKNFG